MGGWVGAVCTLLVWMSLGSFSLRELTCMHCVYLALWTRKVLCGSFFTHYMYIFIHSRKPWQWQKHHGKVLTMLGQWFHWLSFILTNRQSSKFFVHRLTFFFFFLPLTPCHTKAMTLGLRGGRWGGGDSAKWHFYTGLICCRLLASVLKWPA